MSLEWWLIQRDDPESEQFNDCSENVVVSIRNKHTLPPLESNSGVVLKILMLQRLAGW